MTDNEIKPTKGTTSYKVWLEIECYDEATDWSEDMDAPGSALAEFATYEDAYAFACEVTNAHAEPLKAKSEPDDWDLPYSITSVCRNDVLLRFASVQVQNLTNADMQRIARKMEDAYVRQQYWDDIDFFAQQILDEKEVTSQEEDNS